MPKLILKPGTSIFHMTPQMVVGLMIAHAVYSDVGYDCIVTAGDNGKHMKGSLHYKGNAVDLRTNHLPVEVREKVVLQLRACAGESFDVVFEPDEYDDKVQVKWQHIHFEYDPKLPSHSEEPIG